MGDAVFCAANIGNEGHLGLIHSPLFVGSASNHPAMPGFKAPDERLPVIPSERMLDRHRDAVERCVGWLKERRGLATRHEKLAAMPLAVVQFAMCRRYLRILDSRDRA